jgi:glycosyltransferase involved in cell wall biosynthesis
MSGNSREPVALTIAIPTYNRSGKVLPLVASILDQVSDADEVIVSDDGSTDDTIPRLREIQGIRVLQNATNQGMVANWNRCLKSANRDWICIVHDDDLLAPGALAAMRQACSLLKEPALILHDYQGERFDGAFRCTISRPCGWSVLHCPTIPSGAVVHRSVIDAVGTFDTRFSYCADLEYFARVAARYPLAIIESPRVVTFRLHHSNYEFSTWKTKDLLKQLEDAQSTIIRHAGCDEKARAKTLLQSRMQHNLTYMLKIAGDLGDRSLVRKIAADIYAYRDGLSLRRKAMISLAALTGISSRSALKRILLRKRRKSALSR